MKRLVYFLLLAGLTSCMSDLNLDPDNKFTLNSEWSVPLIHARLNLGNLVEEDSLVSSDPDGLIHVIFRKDSVFSHSVFDYTQIPNQDPVTTDITIGSPNVSYNANLGTFGGAKMKSIGIATGNLKWKITSPVNNNIEIFFTILNSSIGGQPFTFTALSNGMGETNGIIPVNNLNIDLTQGTPAYNNIGLSAGVSDDGNAPAGTKIELELQFENLSVKEAIGYFGDHSIKFPSGKLYTDLSVFSNLAENFYLADPKIKLFARSNIGLPLQINAGMIGVGKKGKIVDLGLSPLFFNGSNTLGTYNTDTFLISTANSNIDDFIALVPNEIIYSGNVKLNPNGQTLYDNFITQSGRMNIGFEIDLPLELKTKNLIVDQTIYDVDFGISEEDADFVEELSLGFRIENGFPLEADVYLYFTDSVGAVLDSASIMLFDAATVDAQGNVIAPAKHDRFLNFDRSEIKNILKSDNIRVKVILNTTDNGNQVVRLLTSYYIDVRVGVKTKLNYKLN